MKIHTNDPKFWDKIERQVTRYKDTGKFEMKKERIYEVPIKIYGSECNLDCYMCPTCNPTTRLNGR